MNSTRQALVLGLGDSGEAAARLLLRDGWRVWVVDAACDERVAARADDLRARGVEVHTGVRSLPDEPFELAVVSPGIPEHHPWVLGLRERRVPVLAELELGWRRCGVRTIAVTGSNGKSTAVKWLAEALGAAGFTAVPAGNYGRPACDVACDPVPPQWLVLEVSSFQLETVERFRPEVGVILNIQPNHLDRHGTFERYRALKWRLVERMGPGNVAVVPAELRTGAPALACEVRTFGGAEAEADYRFVQGRVIRGTEPVLDVRGTWFDNEVYGLTAAAVAAALDACGVGLAHAERAARVFEPLRHRMMLVAEIGGVRYIDDSKSTNASALAAAVRMCGDRVRLIAGGLSKNEDYRAVANVLSERVVKVYLIGSAASAMEAAWSDRVPCERCDTLERAVRCAHKEARGGETVLLSPGCASFDQFRSYRERGERFVECVRELIDRPGADRKEVVTCREGVRP